MTGRFGRESLRPKVENSIITMSIHESNSLKSHTHTHFMQHTHNATSCVHTSKASGRDDRTDTSVNLQEK